MQLNSNIGGGINSINSIDNSSKLNYDLNNMNLEKIDEEYSDAKQDIDNPGIGDTRDSEELNVLIRNLSSTDTITLLVDREQVNEDRTKFIQ